MTREELARSLKVKDSYVANHWQEIKARYEKYGIKMIKVGRGSEARYAIKLPGDERFRWEEQHFL